MTTVLIIEQDRRRGRLIGSALRDAGLEAITAHSCEGAIGQVDTLHPGVIVFDADPASAEPRRYLQRMRELSPQSRVLDLHGDLEIGADACLRKPLDTDSLIRTVRRLAQG